MSLVEFLALLGFLPFFFFFFFGFGKIGKCLNCDAAIVLMLLHWELVEEEK